MRTKLRRQLTGRRVEDCHLLCAAPTLREIVRSIFFPINVCPLAAQNHFNMNLNNMV
jgi:hypothetical protein